jgi:hypothetical protein
MDLSTTRSSSAEDVSSIRTEDVDNNASSSSLPIHHMDNVDLNNQCEQLGRQVEELIKQLHESKSAEKRANDEREKFSQMYHRTNERFLTFERKQLDQLRRILTILTPDQHKILEGKNKFFLFSFFSFSLESQNDYRRPRRAFTSPSTSILLPSSLNQSFEDPDTTYDHHKSDIDWNTLLSQVCYVAEPNKIDRLFI